MPPTFGSSLAILAECDQLLKAADNKNTAVQDATLAENQPCTGRELFMCAHAASCHCITGLGPAVDDELLAGGLWSGEVVEIFGPAGVGKTQLALTVAAHYAGWRNPGDHHIYWLTAKDPPEVLAQRLAILFAVRKMPIAALGQIKLKAVSDLSELQAEIASIASKYGKYVASIASSRDRSVPPALVVIDGLSLLLSMMVLGKDFNHRWRLAWVWRELRRVAREGNLCILLLSHVTSGPRKDSAPGKNTDVVPALGGLWDAAAAIRLELHSEGLCGARGTQMLSLILHKSPRMPAGRRATLILDGSGVHSFTKDYREHQ